MRFRIQHPGGRSSLKIEDAPVEILLKQIEKTTNISPSFQTLKAGFPPKEIIINDTSVLISAILKNGDTIVVEKSKTPRVAEGAKPQTTNTTSKPATCPPASSSSMTIYKIPDDNSCLFRALAYLCEGDDSSGKVSELRQMIGALVLSDPQKWNSGILGMKPEKYVEYIMKPNTWGGSIELSILSDFYQVQIVAIEVKNQAVYRFGEDRGYAEQVFTLYDGVHYDALRVDNTRRFPRGDPLALPKALQVAQEAQATGQFTDVYTFKLKCGVCGAILKGQEGAQKHAESTGHQNFSQV